MNLYQIDREILSCVDPETGEILDFERLDALQMDKRQKIENVACWVKNLKADESAFQAEKNALADREKSTRAKRERLERYLADILQGEKFSTAKCAVSFRRSESVKVEDENSVPKAYLRETVTTAPDKVAIKAAIKAGQEVAGCSLVSSLSCSIK